MLRRNSERLSPGTDLQPNHRYIGEILSTDIPPERRTILIRDNDQKEAIELDQQDEVVVLLDHAATGKITEAVIRHPSDQNRAFGIDLVQMGKDQTTLFVDSLTRTADTWTIDEGPDFEPLGLDMTNSNGYLCGVQNDIPFVIELDEAQTVTKCHIWNESNACWCCMPQPLNPDYIQSLLPYVATVASLDSAMLDRAAAVTTGIEEINHLNPVLARLKEEKARRNPSQQWGRELSHMADTRVAGVFPESGSPAHKVVFTPEWQFGKVTAELNHMRGLRGLEGTQFIWGTSFCRADIKEVFQYFSLAKALEARGVTDKHAAYFVDPNAHSTKELLEAMARDFNLDYDQLVATLQLEPARALPIDTADGHSVESDMLRMSENQLLPPSFYTAPRPEQFDQFNGGQLGEVLEIWKEAAASEPKTLGDWRIAVDRLTIARLAQKVGVDPDFVRVVSMEDIVGAVPNMTTRRVVDEVVRMWNEHKPRLQAALVGDVPETDTDDMPMVFRLVLPDGRRIGINTRYEPIDLNTREIVDNPFAREVGLNLRHRERGYDSMPLQQAFEQYPLQFSGLGYYLFTKALSHANDRALSDTDTIPGMHQSVMIIDDYEQSLGPTAAGMALYEHMRVVPYSIPKGLVGIRTPRQIDFDTTPDASAFLNLPDEEFAHVQTFIKSTADTMLSDDIGSATGIVIDPSEQRVTCVTRVPGRRQMLALAETVDSQTVSADLGTTSYEYKMARFLPTAVMAVRPDNVSPLFKGHFDTSAEVDNRLAALRSAIDIGAHTNATLPEVHRYTETLENIQQLLRTGEELARQIASETFSPEEWHAYWHNNIEATTIAAYRTGLPIISVDRRSLTDLSELEKSAMALNGLYRAQVESSVSAEMSANRPETVLALNRAITSMDAALSQFDLAKNVVAMVSKLRAVAMPDAQMDSPSTIINSFSGVDLDAFKALMDVQFELKRPEMMALLQQVGAALSSNPDWMGDDSPKTNWAIQKAKELISRTGKSKTPDFTKASFELDDDDMTAILDRATAQFQAQVAALSELTGIPIPEKVLKENGRVHDMFKRWKDEITQKVSIIGLQSDLHGISQPEIAEIMTQKIDASKRAGLKSQYEALVKGRVDAIMTQFNEVFTAERDRLNLTSGLEGKIQGKRAIEDRVHHEVIVPLRAQKQSLGTLHDAARAEYTQWWHATAQALIRQGFPVSGNAN